MFLTSHDVGDVETICDRLIVINNGKVVSTGSRNMVVGLSSPGLYESINYEIKSLDEITLYCFNVNSKNHIDYKYKISNLYKNIKDQGIYKLMNEVGMYAISSKEGDIRNYFLGSSKKFPNTVKKKIPKGKYIKFNIGKRQQENISKMKKVLYKNWLPSTNFIIEKSFDIEYYEGDICYRYILIK